MSPRNISARKTVLFSVITISLGGALAWWWLGNKEAASTAPPAVIPLIVAAPSAARGGGIISIREVSVKVLELEENPGRTVDKEEVTEPAGPPPESGAKAEKRVLPGMEVFLKERETLVSELGGVLEELKTVSQSERLARLDRWRVDNADRLRRNREKALFYKEQSIDSYQALISR